MANGSPDDPGGEAADATSRLLVQARDDAEAFGAFFDQLRGPVAGFFYRRTACGHTSAELMAETFAQALASLHRYRPDRGTGRSWVFGIANNQYKRWLRTGRVRAKARRQVGIATPLVHEDDLAQIEDLVDFAALRADLGAALDSLPTATRDAVVMRIVEQRPYDQIAERLSCTEVNARVRVSRGLDRLAERVGAP